MATSGESELGPGQYPSRGSLMRNGIIYEEDVYFGPNEYHSKDADVLSPGRDSGYAGSNAGDDEDDAGVGRDNNPLNEESNGGCEDPTVTKSGGDPDGSYNSVCDRPSRALPDYAEDLRVILTSFPSGSIPRRTEGDTFEPEYERMRASLAEYKQAPKWKAILLPPQSIYWLPEFKKPRRAEEKRIEAECDQLDELKEIAEKAAEACTRKEDFWMQLNLKHFFKQYDDVVPPRTRSDHLHLIFDRWRLAQNVPWYQSPEVPKDRGFDRAGGLRAPKPDLTYSFPVYDATVVKKLEQQSPGYARMPCVTNFAFEFLKRAFDHGVRPSPTTALGKAYGKRDDLKEEDLMCFPWAVVEAKHKDAHLKEGDKCYRQAANAAAAALDIERSLSDKLSEQALLIYPVTAFTCCGPEVKVWIAFWQEIDGVEVRRMTCIWEADITTTWGVLSIRLIIENLQYWFKQLRFNLTSRLTQFKELHDSREKAASSHPQTPPRKPNNGLLPHHHSTTAVTRQRNNSNVRQAQSSTPTKPRGLQPPAVSHMRARSLEPNVEKLTHRERSRHGHSPSPPKRHGTKLNDGLGGMYEVEKLIDRKTTAPKLTTRVITRYLVRWEGYGSDDDEWLPESELSSARDLIKEYDEMYGSDTSDEDGEIERRTRLGSGGRRRFG